MSLCSLFTLSSIEHSLCHGLLFPKLYHLTLMTSYLAVSGSLAAFPLVSTLRFSCNLHLRGARSAQGYTAQSLTAWCWLYSSVHRTPLGQQQATRWEPIPGGFPVLFEARLRLFLHHCTNSHQALIYGLKEDEKKGGTTPVGAGILWSQS